MKHTLTASRAACTLTALSLAVVPNSALYAGNKPKIPAVPSGWLTAYPEIVLSGTHPDLTWAITYPSDVPVYVEVISPATLKTRETVDVEVRVIGNGVTAHDPTTGEFIDWVDAGAYVSYDGGSYEQIFHGDNLEVKPNKEVWTLPDVPPGKKIRFGGRYEWEGSTGPFRHSEGNTDNVRTLINGDIPPTSEPMHTSPALEEFMEPYLDGDGRVNIGPMDVIVFTELTHDDTQKTHHGYDLQDLVLLVTFKSDKPKNNNGHGNNLDSVDMSNPGNAPFMIYDTDPTVDDEGGGGGAEPSS
jgi:hypothetical protein